MKPLSATGRALLLLLAVLAFASPAVAHVGSKDVFEQVAAGRYQLFVPIRPPDVIPGVAVIEVRTSGSTVNTLSIAPTPLTGEAAAHPPSSDAMQRSTADPAFFTGSLFQPWWRSSPCNISHRRWARPRVECCSSRVAM